MNGINDLQTAFGALGGSRASGKSMGAAERATDMSAAAAARTQLPGEGTVSLSAMAGQLAKAVHGSEIRMEKVARLQAAIASGTYSVSSGEVADKLMVAMMGGH